jgi:hypothetical protein
LVRARLAEVAGSAPEALDEAVVSDGVILSIVTLVDL